MNNPSGEKKIKLIFGSHAHVPYGAGVEEFENIYKNLLKPFISNLYKYPRIQASVHYSGVLLHWIERSYPEIFMLIEDMVSRKQIEMLGGGFYEPILPIIGLQDKIGQIELLTTYLRKQFGKRPQGCWIPDFAWEQNLVSPLAACGMGYTFLSESQFALAGGKEDPCICEDQGKIITVFPVWTSLENEMANKNISAALLAYSSKFPEKKELIISVFPCKLNFESTKASDITWNHFLEELSLCENYVETTTPGKLYKNINGLQKLNIPDSFEAQVAPRRFIAINQESARIYSKMVFINLLIHQLKGDKSRKQSAREEIWKSQSGALFSSNWFQVKNNQLLRGAACSALLNAEKLIRDKGKFTSQLVSYDINLDNIDEWLFHDAKINFYVQSLGGGIFELDHLPNAWNYLNTINNRLAYADRLLPADTKIENIDNEKIPGARFCFREYYELQGLDKNKKILRLALNPLAAAKPALAFGSVSIKKIFSQKKDSVITSYSLINNGEKPEKFQFAPMIDLAFKSESKTRFFSCKTGGTDSPISDFSMRNIDGLKIHDIENEVQITLTANRPINGRISPVFLSDGKKNSSFQAYCIMPIFHVTLKPAESRDIEFILKFTH